MIVAIDGPAGAGKSTVAKALAKRLRYAYLDTGAMYRCVALAALRRWGEAANDPRRAGALGPLAESLAIELRADAGASEEMRNGVSGEGSAGVDRVRDGVSGAGSAGVDGVRDGVSGAGAARGEVPERGPVVLLDGEDVTAEIRTREVSEMASVVAAVSGVRAALVSKQRQLIASGSWVAEGRDVGTVIAPHAELKVFLTAEPGERAKRRAVELGADVRTVLAEQAIRDSRDSQREHSPLEAAADAVSVDTTGLSVSDVVAAIAKMISC